MKCLSFSVVALVSFASATRADLIAYEAFNQPDISSSIFRQETGVGFVGPWKSWGGAPDQTNLKISEGSLNYAGLLTEGKAHSKFEFGPKASIAQTKISGIIVAAQSFQRSPYDGDTFIDTLV